MGESMLNALNDGDYATWSENWTAELRDAIGEDAFLEFRDQALEQRGAFQEIVSVELQPGTQPGFVRWVVTAEHEEGTSESAMAFATDGREITGVFWEPVD